MTIKDLFDALVKAGEEQGLTREQVEQAEIEWFDFPGQPGEIRFTRDVYGLCVRVS